MMDRSGSISVDAGEFVLTYRLLGLFALLFATTLNEYYIPRENREVAFAAIFQNERYVRDCKKEQHNMPAANCSGTSHIALSIPLAAALLLH